MKWILSENKHKQKKNVGDYFKQTFFEQGNLFKRGIFEELWKLAIYVQFFVPIFLVAYGASFMVTLVISAVFTWFTSYLRTLSNVINETGSTIPIPSRSFIEVDRDGFIGLKNENDLPELIQYTYELESYLKSKGRMKE